MMSFAVLLIGLLTISGQTFGGSCPDASHLSSCTCTGDKVSCYDFDNGIDLASEFEAIEHGHNPGDQFFEFFELSSNTLEKLEADVFRGVTFRELKFNHNPRLSCVDTRAFTGNEKVTTRVFGINSNFSVINETCNIFSALSSLNILETVNITGSSLKEVPTNAFSGRGGQQNNLRLINLSGGQGGQITKIGKGAFSQVKNLNYIDLSYHKITSIERNAFEFIEANDNELIINLERNWKESTGEGLTGESFDGPVFMVGNRRTTLRLGKNPGLQYLKEETFLPFLVNKNNPNAIDLDGTSLGYYWENQWMLEMKESLGLIDKIKNIRTIDGESIWREPIKKFSVTPTTVVPTTTPGSTTPNAGSTTTSTGTTIKNTGTTVTTTATTKTTTHLIFK